MRIKHQKTYRENVLRKIRLFLFKNFKQRRVKFVSKVLFVVFLIGFVTSAFIYRRDINRFVIQPSLYKLKIIPNAESFFIDIKHTDYQRLAYKRKISLKKGVLFSDSDDYVPARLTYKNKTYKIKLRLKGDGRDHWEHEYKWSFRIKVSNDKTIMGMKRFSIQHPRTRGYLVEWLFHRLLDYSGLIHLRYDFVNVVVNGENLGLYAIEEHFNKLLVERNHYREGPIIRFNDELYWENYARNNNRNVDYAESYFMGSIDAFGPAKIAKNKNLKSQFVQAMHLLEAYREGELETGKVFNIEKLARFFAVTDLWGNPHAHEFHNVRFYYNPITSLLEPIGYDTTDMNEVAVLSGSTQLNSRKRDWSTWEKKLFDDFTFFKAYVKELEYVASDEFIDGFLQEKIKTSKEKNSYCMQIIQNTHLISFPIYTKIRNSYRKPLTR